MVCHRREGQAILHTTKAAYWCSVAERLDNFLTKTDENVRMRITRLYLERKRQRVNRYAAQNEREAEDEFIFHRQILSLVRGLFAAMSVCNRNSSFQYFAVPCNCGGESFRRVIFNAPCPNASMRSMSSSVISFVDSGALKIAPTSGEKMNPRSSCDITSL